MLGIGLEVATTATTNKVPLGLEDLKSAIISQSTDITAVIVTCQCCGSHVYLKYFNNTTDRKITGDGSGGNLQPNLYVQQGISSITQTPSVDHGEESLNFIDSRLIFLVPSSMSTTPALQDGVSTYDAHINFGFFDPSSSLHAYLRRLSKKLVNSSADVINGVPLSREELWALARKLQ